MRDYELELIASLAEGSLDDETEARALIDSSPEYRAEYEAQLLAIASLRQVEPVVMTDTEKAALHRDLWTALRDVPAVGTGASTPWYYRWTPVAAGLLVVVGLVAILSGGGESDRGSLAEGAATTSTAAADTATGGESTGDDGDLAPAETTVTESGEGDGAAEDLYGPAGALTEYARVAARLRAGDLSSVEEEPTVTASSRDLADCLTEAGLDGFEVLGTIANPAVGDTTPEGTVPADAPPLIAAVSDDADLSTATFAFVDLDTCEVVYLDE